MGTKLDPGKFDCYANAEPDEPMFILLGRDPMAGALVREWARWREAAGEDPAKVEEARATARLMDARAMARGKHPVDHAYVSLEECAQVLFRSANLNLHADVPGTLDLGDKRALVRQMLQRAWNLGRMGITGFESTKGAEKPKPSWRMLLDLAKKVAATAPFVDEKCFSCPRCRILTAFAKYVLKKEVT